MSQQPAVHHIPGSRTEALRSACRGLLQEIRSELIVDTRWHLPFPTVPAAQLIYVPNRVRDIFACPTSTINQSDIDAMSFGILERLNLNYFATQPYEMKTIRDAVAKAEADYEAHNDERKANGLAIDPLPKLTERYRNLEQEDADLVEEDLGVHPLDQDSLPSGTLQKNHIYTELGRTPAHLRAQHRLNAPFARFGLTNENGEQIMDGAGSDLASSVGGANSNSMMSLGFSQSQASQFSGLGGVGGGSQQQQKEVVSAEERWVKQVNMSFKNAKQLDALFTLFLDRIALQVLGVKVGAGSAEEISPVKESLRAFTKKFLQLTMNLVAASPKLATQLVERTRALVSGEIAVEDAHKKLDDDWNFAANEDELLMTTQALRDRFLGETLALFSDWELDVNNEQQKQLIKFSQQERKPFGSNEEGGQGVTVTSLLRSVHNATVPQDKRSISLTNPDLQDDIPVAILPVLPADKAHDAPVKNLSARIFLNVAQSTQADEDDNEDEAAAKKRNFRKSMFGKTNNTSVGGENNKPYTPTVMFGNGELLLRPVQNKIDSDDNNNQHQDVMEYQPETSSFDVLKSDDNADGIYLLKVGQDAARFARVPNTVEYLRRPGTEQSASEVEHSTVIWEDVAVPATNQQQ